MFDILLIVITVSVLAVVAFLIPLLIEARRTSVALRRSTEEKLNPALEELQLTLKDLRNISENINNVTEDVREFSGSINEAGQKIYAVSAAADEFLKSTVSLRVKSFSAGVAGTLSYLTKHLLKKGEK